MEFKPNSRPAPAQTKLVDETLLFDKDALIWKVVGGEKTAGIVVRTGLELDSGKESLRLATGALVEQLELCGERLCYRLIEGRGPYEGWVSTWVSGKDLLVRYREDENLPVALYTAADWIMRADALVVAMGQGAIAEFGLPVFSAGMGRRFAELREIGKTPETLCDPKWFKDNARLAWGFWLTCCKTYREAKPHKVHELLSTWGDMMTSGKFAITDSVDGHLAASGWGEDRLLEIFGAVRFLRCGSACCEDIWPMPEDLELTRNPETFEAEGKLPKCPKCNGIARPCARLDSEDDCPPWQMLSFRHWCNGLKADGKDLQRKPAKPLQDPDPSVVCLQLGSMTNNLRKKIDDAMGPHGRLISLVADGTKALGEQRICMPLGTAEGLRRIAKLTHAYKRAVFLLRDDDGNGAEVEDLPDASAGRLFRRALAALGQGFWRPEASDPKLKFVAENVQARHLRWELSSEDPVPDQLFYCPARDMPIVQVNVVGSHFGGRNDRLKDRLSRVTNLVNDLRDKFSESWYQERLASAEDRPALQMLIGEGYWHVLPNHGFSFAEDDVSEQLMVQMDMQGFLKTGAFTPEIAESIDKMRDLSGTNSLANFRTKVPPKSDSAENTTVVLIRHGEREDYTAGRLGLGAVWVQEAMRPWDPSLSDEGRVQVRRAARRLRFELAARSWPEPSFVFTSPYCRCLETGDLMAQEFSVDRLLVEEGLVETVCEAWMRQWAVMGADTTWGGPPHSAMPEKATHAYSKTVAGPAVPERAVRHEALEGIRATVMCAEDLAAGMFHMKTKVDPDHESHISIVEKEYCWGNFEPKPLAIERVVETVRARVAEHPGKTLVFVSHGGPTLFAIEELGHTPPPGSGGMASLSLLRWKPKAGKSGKWDATLLNDAAHEPYAWRRRAL